MRFGFTIPGPGDDVHTVVELAVEAERAGWDGVFLPDCICIDTPMDPAMPAFDPWVALAAIAARTERVRMGPMITPLSRRRPWKVAREVLTLDHLSNGRAVLPVGLGALDDAGFGRVGEATERKTRVELLDESLAIIAGLWSGEPFQFEGKHYHLGEMTFLPRPVQQPRVPIWVVGVWPREKSLGRAARWDGVIPQKMEADGEWGEMTAEDVREMRAWVAERRGGAGTEGFDVVMEGETPGGKPETAAEQVGALAEAGVTWWLESMWSPRWQREGYANEVEASRERIRQGPPRLER